MIKRKQHQICFNDEGIRVEAAFEYELYLASYLGCIVNFCFSLNYIKQEYIEILDRITDEISSHVDRIRSNKFTVHQMYLYCDAIRYDRNLFG